MTTGSSSFDEAARDLGIPSEVFMLWVLRRKRPLSVARWSQFEGGHKPIPDDWIRDYLRETRLSDASDVAILSDIVHHIQSEFGTRLSRMAGDLKSRFADHLKRQVSLVFDAADQPYNVGDGRSGAGTTT